MRPSPLGEERHLVKVHPDNARGWPKTKAERGLHLRPHLLRTANAIPPRSLKRVVAADASTLALKCRMAIRSRTSLSAQDRPSSCSTGGMEEGRGCGVRHTARHPRQAAARRRDGEARVRCRERPSTTTEDQCSAARPLGQALHQQPEGQRFDQCGEPNRRATSVYCNRANLSELQFARGDCYQ